MEYSPLVGHNIETFENHIDHNLSVKNNVNQLVSHSWTQTSTWGSGSIFKHFVVWVMSKTLTLFDRNLVSTVFQESDLIWSQQFSRNQIWEERTLFVLAQIQGGGGGGVSLTVFYVLFSEWTLEL